MNNTEITNQDDILKKSSTSGGVFVDKTNDSTEPNPNLKDEIITDENESKNISDDYSAKPVDIAKQKFYESQKTLNDGKTACWNRFKVIMTVAGVFIGFIITFLSIFWAYKLNNIAEPIGGIKESMQSIKDENKNIEDRIQRNEDRLNELINKIIDQKFKN